MDATILTNVVDALPQFDGYVYPNERTLHPLWSVLIVVYPYITGLVAGAFIMASLVRVFKVKALEPIYRLALLTALAFMLCATLPLLFHLGHPERCFEIMMTPHFSSPMAMFGFVYAWYLMAVLLLELWFDYRRDFVEWSRTRNRLARHHLPRVHPGSDRPFRAGAASGCAHGPDHFRRRHSVGVSVARVRRISFSARSRPIRGGATR